MAEIIAPGPSGRAGSGLLPGPTRGFGPPLDAGTIGAAIGRATMVLGLLLLGFAAYQLWGTDLTEARSQEELATEWAATLERSARTEPHRPASPINAHLAWIGEEPGIGQAEPADAAIVGGETTASTDGPLVVASVLPRPPLEVGQPFATLRIPAIGLDKTVVEGTTREALRTGPGHYRGTAAPGSVGNVAIAGHRTTYGAPFRDIDRLVPGDPIVIETADGAFTYRVEGQLTGDGDTVGHRIVAPERVDVIADQGDHRLTLTACHPLYSARQRIVVTAVLDGPGIDGTDPSAQEIALPQPGLEITQPPQLTLAQPTEAGPGPEAAPSSEWAPSGPATTGRAPGIAGPATTTSGDDLGWQSANAGATIGWAALTALVAATAWLLGRLWRRVPAYLMAMPSFGLCLLTCFGHLDRLIPAA